MNSYSEVRRVRAAMSKEAGHDVRRLIATINERRSQAAARIIDPGTDAERCGEEKRSAVRDLNEESFPTAG